jgi:hypothetical protein
MLAFKKLGITPIVMSAGELESGNAGEPAKLIRQRYREASDIIKKGKMCALFINDLDAGAGRFGMTTQYTVNNQMVNATLMNIADNPTNVQLPGEGGHRRGVGGVGWGTLCVCTCISVGVLTQGFLGGVVQSIKRQCAVWFQHACAPASVLPALAVYMSPPSLQLC